MDKDAEKFLYDPGDENSLFNIPLSNGKTLIYMACQEGKEDILRFFLEKKLCPLINSKTEFNKYENCLDVAVRWNFVNIVEILLETKLFRINMVKDALGKRNLNKRKN